MEKIIDIDFLQNLQDKLSEDFGVGSVITNIDGIPITKPSNFSKLCKLIREIPEGESLCKKCDSINGNKAMISKRPVVYKCHIGLTDFASPIIIEDKLVGCFLCGQIITDIGEIDNFEKILTNLGIDSKNAQECIAQLKIIPLNVVENIANFLYEISSRISQYSFYQNNVFKNKLLLNSELLSLNSVYSISPPFKKKNNLTKFKETFSYIKSIFTFK